MRHTIRTFKEWMQRLHILWFPVTRLFVAVVMVGALSTPLLAQVPDAFPIQDSRIVNAPDIRNWPATAAITSIVFDGSSTRVDFTRKDGPNRWPDVVPAGWDGPLQYTLWLFLQVDGQWVGSGFIQFWNGRDATGGPSDPDVPSRFHDHWFYSSRWAPLYGHGQIRAGELIGFMVSSGNARDGVGPYGPRERSNVVTFPATDRGTFSFAAGPAPMPVPRLWWWFRPLPYRLHSPPPHPLLCHRWI